MGKATFWNLIAKRYARSPIGDQESYDKKLGITRQYLKPQSEVLEIGCGTGSTALLHAPNVKSILASDVAGKMIDIAREKLVETNIDNLVFRQADLDELSGEGKTFDAILALNVLHLLDDLDTALSQIARLLKKDGVLVSSTACLRGKYRLLRGIGALFRLLGLFPTLNAFSENELLEAHRRAGFAIEVQWTPDGSDVIFMVARKVNPEH